MKLKIRLLEPREWEQAGEVIRAAFGRPMPVESMLQLHHAMEPEGFWVAELDGRIVGTVGAANYGAVAYIALMSVHPSAQKQGIGRRLMEHALAWLKRRTDPIVLLDATDPGAALYLTMGFVDDSTAREMVLDGRSATAALPKSVRAATDDDLTAIVALDERAFGAKREKLFRVLWPDYRQRVLVALDERRRLTGYLIAREMVLGPWAAVDARAARQLLAGALALPFGNSPMVMVPRSNEAAAELLGQCGFIERRQLRHMRLGGAAPPGEARLLFGQASFGHG